MQNRCSTLGVLLTLTALSGGCSSGDADHLAKLGRVVVAKTRQSVDSDGRLTQQWQNLCRGWCGSTAESRVLDRLRWDKSLAGCQIQVRTSDDMIELTGTVHNPDQRHRATALAESTEGVERVKDSLEEVPGDSP